METRKVKQNIAFFVIRVKHNGEKVVSVNSDCDVNINLNGEIESPNFDFHLIPFEKATYTWVPESLLPHVCSELLRRDLSPIIKDVIYPLNREFGDTAQLPQSFRWGDYFA
jgi:hypothetical protein